MWPVRSSTLAPVGTATAFVGDPSFAILSFNEDYVMLGQGFGNGTTANASVPQDVVGLTSGVSSATISSNFRIDFPLSVTGPHTRRPRQSS